MSSQTRKHIARACALLTLSASFTPARAGVPADDLKQIEYRYYFRGKYPQAVEALQTFLARIDVSGQVALRANEFLAASHVLSGAPQAGRDVFARVIAANPSYAGPDPAIFKPEVIDVYGAARSEYDSLALRHAAPADSSGAAGGGAPAPAVVNAAGKPIYRKWWFYAGAAAVAGVVAGLAASSGDDDAPSAPSGTVTVGVRVQ
jgi:hypothetical protein